MITTYDDVDDPNDAAEYGSPAFDDPETKNFNPDSLALQAENVSVQAVEEETGIANAISIGGQSGKFVPFARAPCSLGHLV